MNRMFVTLCLMAVLLLPASVLAQKSIYGGTGAVRFKLDKYGRFEMYDKDFVTQLDRASILIALDPAHVFDYQEDAMNLTASPILSSVGKADTVLTALFDNSYLDPIPPPDAQVLEDVYGWKGDSLVLVNYSITNSGTASYTVYVGMGCVPSPSETYGGETVAYDATKKMAYFFREGETPYVGIKLIGQDPLSFHALDWDTYSPTDAASDAATDSTRWQMTALPGFDAPLIAGVNGSFFNLNFGSETIDSHSSKVYTVAYLYSTSLAGLRALSDSADVRFAQLEAAATIKTAYGGTGAVRFKVDRFGRFEMYDKDFTTQLDRASLVVALDKAHVFDYQEEANYIMSAPALSVGGAADTVAKALFDNTYNSPAPPPDVRVLEEAHAWINDPFVLVDYTITNYTTTASTVIIGMGCVPSPSETYGGETVAFDDTKKMAYFFREGEAPYVGVKLIGQDPVSFHALDWDAYSPDDASADAATDSTRWDMTALPGFDAPLIAGVNGSFFNLNFGSTVLDPKTSITYTVAYLYGTSLENLLTVSDAAEARYNLSTAVEPGSPVVPERFALEQNYPNPFNPTTVVSGQWPVASRVKLVVYDLLGRQVAVLADGQYPAGQFEFKFDGSRLASGVYFCRLTAGSYMSTMKMVLQK
jgi:hypothetical protein